MSEAEASELNSILNRLPCSPKGTYRPLYEYTDETVSTDSQIGLSGAKAETREILYFHPSDVIFISFDTLTRPVKSLSSLPKRNVYNPSNEELGSKVRSVSISELINAGYIGVIADTVDVGIRRMEKGPTITTKGLMPVIRQMVAQSINSEGNVVKHQKFDVLKEE
ncbi:hypothetical protein A3K34_02285 [candidate division WWE3 bacterium RIFOXYC1_FULL_40_10]|uniref:Uncharacterized protein n=1 Tax=candidate division WWE3 bacterium RIFOXYA2_FULL_46_9 TaxID=1802636 RepID=A0A1F4VZV8_UNCKA|nr:MAG: hypothetical protein A3K58_02285 [candidate division WWE3 bacterium RIFOXYB1_FULL_40_22]OGC61682.1 MAG: hypothetical protein A3K37_02285 [candidate division WWE3 bacterium RIFOXYA1_FULL_40_11]OGC62333.1 MAG: hypothetical protein A2264_02085 [candidate division WWE3 bacterium RIFOXYA2_FULL_46_9]OGC64857.1 MAG: hypothetical protein A2326_01110 [candidate division WWE3 bacterium RIFOXYB2_FULL_41_6]OGC66065.1 MAG: hypothetical protein A3K34_02285 [candidate division WWE3 bacterium RIFOXYC1_